MLILFVTLLSCCNLEMYYHFLNQANLNLVEERYKEAVVYYKEAFKQTEQHPELYQVWNAMIAANIIKDEQSQKEFLKILFQHGITLNYVKQNSPIVLNNATKKIYQKQHKVYLSQLDKKLQATIDSFYHADQDPRNQWHRNQKENSTLNTISYYDLCRKIDTTTMLAFLPLLKSGRLKPTQIRDTNEFNPQYNILLLHYHQQTYSAILEPFEDFFKKGYLSRYEYASISEVYYSSGRVEPKEIYGYVSMIYQIDSVCYDLNPENEEEINENRRKISLIAYETARKLYDLSVKNKYFKFPYTYTDKVFSELPNEFKTEFLIKLEKRAYRKFNCN